MYFFQKKKIANFKVHTFWTKIKIILNNYIKILNNITKLSKYFKKKNKKELKEIYFKQEDLHI